MGREFNQRFGFEIDLPEAQERFINRIYLLIFRNLREPVAEGGRKIAEIKAAALEIGVDPYGTRGIEKIAGRNFHDVLKSVSAIYSKSNASTDRQAEIDAGVRTALEESEVDLGIYWEDGQFYLSGAKLLDDKLVNKNLEWLLEKGYENVYTPFEKALQHYSESIKHPGKLHDVITDMYEALEATAKVVGNNDRGLSANAERFTSSMDLTKQHKEMLKQYIEYANDIARHAQDPNSKRRSVTNAEAENFIYLTGIFIRFAIKKLEEGE